MWNHRVCKETKEYKLSNGVTRTDVIYSIREVYYNKDGGIWGLSSEPNAPISEDLEGLKWTLEKTLAAADKEIVDLDTIVYDKPDFETEPFETMDIKDLIESCKDDDDDEEE